MCQGWRGSCRWERREGVAAGIGSQRVDEGESDQSLKSSERGDWDGC